MDDLLKLIVLGLFAVCGALLCAWVAFIEFGIVGLLGGFVVGAVGGGLLGAIIALRLSRS